MKSMLSKFGSVLAALFVVVSMGGCTTHYSDGTTSGICIGLMCPVYAATGQVGGGVNPASIKFNAAFKVGTTSGQDIANSLTIPATPKSFTKVVVNGVTIGVDTYEYTDKAGVPLEPGVSPEKVLTLYYYNTDPDRSAKHALLVGQSFVSSFRADNTNFDVDKISNIAKGQTTRSEVIKLMGDPSGEFIAPMDNAITYTYTASRDGDMQGKIIAKTKSLKVVFADNDVVSDVIYVDK